MSTRVSYLQISNLLVCTYVPFREGLGTYPGSICLKSIIFDKPRIFLNKKKKRMRERTKEREKEGQREIEGQREYEGKREEERKREKEGKREKERKRERK